jgi:hypothetical protein
LRGDIEANRGAHATERDRERQPHITESYNTDGLVVHLFSMRLKVTVWCGDLSKNA